MFEKIAVGIKTFLRDEKLFRAVDGIRRNMPNAKVIVADDGEMSVEKYLFYDEMRVIGHEVLECNFDAGFGYKSNRIIDALDRPYLLIGSDDFDFTAKAAGGVHSMIDILDYYTELDIISGRLNNRPYEFLLEDRGDTIIEHRVNTDLRVDGLRAQVYMCDLTVNYSLIRREVFDKVKFDDEEVIGEGGHGAFFLDVKRAGFKVGFTPLAEISEQTEPEDSDRYKQYRARARGKSRKTFDRRGIKKYILGTGQIDYENTGSY